MLWSQRVTRRLSCPDNHEDGHARCFMDLESFIHKDDELTYVLKDGVDSFTAGNHQNHSKPFKSFKLFSSVLTF